MLWRGQQEPQLICELFVKLYHECKHHRALGPFLSAGANRARRIAPSGPICPPPTAESSPARRRLRDLRAGTRRGASLDSTGSMRLTSSTRRKFIECSTSLLTTSCSARTPSGSSATRASSPRASRSRASPASTAASATSSRSCGSSGAQHGLLSVTVPVHPAFPPKTDERAAAYEKPWDCKCAGRAKNNIHQPAHPQPNSTQRRKGADGRDNPTRQLDDN